MKKFFCYGKKAVCDETQNCAECAFCNEKGGEYRDIPMTNADRIRSMTVIELADFLDKCEGLGYADSSIAKDERDQIMDMLEWLQHPVKEDAE